ncbi:DNA-directed RNA polymerase core subunit rpc10 [Tilletia horrida]|uniref:DNA-directed RNA polymerase core subunit rpc10 n=1 Tax=Tilletia horrida TaxID=155126 RepID=A0AAN6GC51_9BASI|nr:DNA-directed RNA polymerase core subunit rpc10 [Tilletia horrida]KAK0538215.1 DNA-directed RNA polymerase core subunit rpc10 [Tilletia horrida]KAK0540580.1 DNA-directed RNA polymerase core subunit rpc10 [Tilletia horrida]KAK0566490.1 DNA-directed RNA polymerase core subunit rpc10 [Tilletia horrida]
MNSGGGASGGQYSGAGLGRIQPIQYICADCAATNEIKPREPIRCKDCGHRIMYKKRTKQMLHFLAR